MDACPACEGRRWRPLLEWEGHVYVECEACGAAHLDPVPTPDEAAAHFDDGYFEGGADRAGYGDYLADEKLHRRNARRHLRTIASTGADPGLLVEAGAAAGFLLDEARHQGWQVAGSDVATAMRDEAHDRFGLDLATDLDELPVGRHEASAVVAVQVLEHLPEPEELVGWAADHLRPGGVLLVETWDKSSAAARVFGTRWQEIAPPSVVWLFDRRNLVRLLERYGFRVRRARASIKWVSLDTALSVAADKAGPLGRFEARTRGRRWRRIGVPYALGDLLTVVATAN